MDQRCENSNYLDLNVSHLRFYPKNYVLAYEVVKGFLGFNTSAINTWSLQQAGHQTKVMMHMKIETKGTKGALMGPMLKMQLNKTVEGVLQAFKTFVETGRISKEKELAKFLKKAA